ncbi:DUF6968 family protein [Sphingomonas aerophila]|uniref:DUF6968 domain-containing protein n=1 Tax=Sphingomonas aerophila TaxID=1344948 RepID=A0A7W9EXP6_9SPHN|nr:hypothetical protein [Sphingomonas aerophila]MBB5716783.1 hypothetical protein [Sphingomonas aerophila]
MSGAAFVERIFEDGEREVRCRFFTPQQQPTGEYRCAWTLTWAGETKSHSAHGIDGVQALLLAMRVVHTELVDSESYRAGRFTYLQQRDLDLPPPFPPYDPEA